ncbi:YceI family protein [Actinokineospora sp. 24-640]
MTVQIPAAGEYRIDPTASAISFTTKHMFGLGKVRGSFALRDGLIQVADPVAGSTAWATILAGSFTTGNKARDGMVRSATYLDTGNHPEITYTATGMDKTEDGWTLRGTLTVRGETRPLPVRIESASVDGDQVVVHAAADVDRYEFGITAMKGMTGRNLALHLDLTAVRNREA